RQASSGISSVAWCPHCGQVMIDCFKELLAPGESLAFIASTWDSVFIGQRAHAFCYRFLQNSELIFIQQVACDLTNRELFRSRFCEAFFQCAGECLLEPLPLSFCQGSFRLHAPDQASRNDAGFFFTEAIHICAAIPAAAGVKIL